jgi:integrase
MESAASCTRKSAGFSTFFLAVNRKRPMSENAVNNALRRMGYATGEMIAHGFRSMASTLLNERGWNSDAIERQLPHNERDSVRAADNHAEHLVERRKMMQAWADYLDKLAGESTRVSTQRVYTSEGV